MTPIPLFKTRPQSNAVTKKIDEIIKLYGQHCNGLGKCPVSFHINQDQNFDTEDSDTAQIQSTSCNSCNLFIMYYDQNSEWKEYGICIHTLQAIAPFFT